MRVLLFLSALCFLAPILNARTIASVVVKGKYSYELEISKFPDGRYFLVYCSKSHDLCHMDVDFSQEDGRALEDEIENLQFGVLNRGEPENIDFFATCSVKKQDKTKILIFATENMTNTRGRYLLFEDNRASIILEKLEELSVYGEKKAKLKKSVTSGSNARREQNAGPANYPKREKNSYSMEYQEQKKNSWPLDYLWLKKSWQDNPMRIL